MLGSFHDVDDSAEGRQIGGKLEAEQAATDDDDGQAGLYGSKRALANEEGVVHRSEHARERTLARLELDGGRPRAQDEVIVVQLEPASRLCEPPLALDADDRIPNVDGNLLVLVPIRAPQLEHTRCLPTDDTAKVHAVVGRAGFSPKNDDLRPFRGQAFAQLEAEPMSHHPVPDHGDGRRRTGARRTERPRAGSGKARPRQQMLLAEDGTNEGRHDCLVESPVRPNAATEQIAFSAATEIFSSPASTNMFAIYETYPRKVRNQLDHVSTGNAGTTARVRRFSAGFVKPRRRWSPQQLSAAEVPKMTGCSKQAASVRRFHICSALAAFAPVFRRGSRSRADPGDEHGRMKRPAASAANSKHSNVSTCIGQGRKQSQRRLEGGPGPQRPSARTAERAKTRREVVSDFVLLRRRHLEQLEDGLVEAGESILRRTAGRERRAHGTNVLTRHARSRRGREPTQVGHFHLRER